MRTPYTTEQKQLACRQHGIMTNGRIAELIGGDSYTVATMICRMKKSGEYDEIRRANGTQGRGQNTAQIEKKEESCGYMEGR